jgi:hypothetical protein
MLITLLTCSHTTFAEALKQMYKMADTVTPRDEQNFAIYCFSFAQVFVLFASSLI